jgi:hypothetical protein
MKQANVWMQNGIRHERIKEKRCCDNKPKQHNVLQEGLVNTYPVAQDLDSECCRHERDVKVFKSDRDISIRYADERELWVKRHDDKKKDSENREESGIEEMKKSSHPVE